MAATDSRVGTAADVYLEGQKTTKNITVEELQRRLEQHPNCVIVAGGFNHIRSRDQKEKKELRDNPNNVYLFRGDEIFFSKRFTTFEFMAEGIFFTRFGEANADGTFVVSMAVDVMVAAMKTKSFPWLLDLPRISNIPEDSAKTWIDRRIFGMVMDKDIGNISSKELQDAMNMFPNCLVIAGGYEVFSNRYHEMGIELYRGSGSGFHNPKIFKEPFHSREYMVGNRTFLRLGLGSSFGFKLQEEIAERDLALCIIHYLKFPEKGIHVVRTGTAAMEEDDEDVQYPEDAVLPSTVGPSEMHRNVMLKLRKLLEGRIQNNKFMLTLNNDGMVSNRATKFAFGTIMDALCSEKDGMMLKHGLCKVKEIRSWEIFEVKAILKLQGLKRDGHVRIHLHMHCIPACL